MHWNIKDTPNKETITHLIDCLGIDAVVAQLLAQRNITSFESAKAFLDLILGSFTIPF
jgi:single-stranded-DNA-specific exonuclease